MNSMVQCLSQLPPIVQKMVIHPPTHPRIQAQQIMIPAQINDEYKEDLNPDNPLGMKVIIAERTVRSGILNELYP